MELLQLFPILKYMLYSVVILLITLALSTLTIAGHQGTRKSNSHGPGELVDSSKKKDQTMST